MIFLFLAFIFSPTFPTRARAPSFLISSNKDSSFLINLISSDFSDLSSSFISSIISSFLSSSLFSINSIFFSILILSLLSSFFSFSFFSLSLSLKYCNGSFNGESSSKRFIPSISLLNSSIFSFILSILISLSNLNSADLLNSLILALLKINEFIKPILSVTFFIFNRNII